MAWIWLRVALFILSITFTFTIHAASAIESSLPRNGIIRTIKGENGDVIDCVNIYEQPSLNHPLLRNETIQVANESSTTIINQTWLKSGSCPKGTIPILKSRTNKPIKGHVFLPPFNSNVIADDDGLGTPISTGPICYNGPYRGGKGWLSLWNPLVEPGEYSMAHLTLYQTADPAYVPGSPPPDIANIISVGWMVNPEQHGDSSTRLFTFWSKDNGMSSGCFNLLCPGFVQLNNKIALGAQFEHLSIYGGAQQYSKFTIQLDQEAERWYVWLDGEQLGYWPMSIFGNFWDCDAVQWGGVVWDRREGDSPTPTQMGNGHFPNEGATYSASVLNAVPLDGQGIVNPSKGIFSFIISERPTCYDYKLLDNKPSGSPGFDFLFGGPGSGSSQCQ